MLWETKLTDLNNLRRIKTMDDVKRAAHSQGYDAQEADHDKYGSHGVVELTHRKTGERVEPAKDRGSIGGKKKGKGGEVESTTVNTVADAIKQDITKRGRADKRPAAKAKRKAEAQTNKERKQQQRNPFTRKTYKEHNQQNPEYLL